MKNLNLDQAEKNDKRNNDDDEGWNTVDDDDDDGEQRGECRQEVLHVIGEARIENVDVLREAVDDASERRCVEERRRTAKNVVEHVRVHFARCGDASKGYRKRQAEHGQHC